MTETTKLRVDVGGFCLVQYVCGVDVEESWRTGNLAGELGLWNPDRGQVVGYVKPSPDNYIHGLDPKQDESGNAIQAVGSMVHNSPLGSVVSLVRNGVTFLGLVYGEGEVIYAKYRADNFLRDAPKPLRSRLKHRRKRR